MTAPRTGVRRNPTTGQLETYDLPKPVDLERTRKELRDFLHGNTQWHVDPNAAPPKPVLPDPEEEPCTVPDWVGVYGY